MEMLEELVPRRLLLCENIFFYPLCEVVTWDETNYVWPGLVRLEYIDPIWSLVSEVTSALLLSARVGRSLCCVATVDGDPC